MIFRAGCSHHCLDGRIPRFRSAAKHKSMIGQVAIYCATVFWRRAIHTLISSSPDIASAAPMGEYTHVPYGQRLGPMPAIRCAARPSRAFSNRGVSTHVLETNSSTTCTNATYNFLAVLLSNIFCPKIYVSRPHSPAPSGGSVTPPANRRQWTTTFILSNRTKRPLSLVSYTLRRPAPSAPPSPQPETSFASSLSRAGTLLIEVFLWNKHATLGAPGLGLISLLQDEYAVPRVLVGKVFPEVFP